MKSGANAPKVKPDDCCRSLIWVVRAKPLLNTAHVIIAADV